MNDVLPRLPLFMLAEQIAIVVVAFVWLSECDDRAKERHYRAWELINAARGSTGDGGRRDALEALNKDHVSLAGAPLEDVWVPKVDLRRADLFHAYLQGAFLGDAKLQGAFLGNAKLHSAALMRADLTGANLKGADLQVAQFWDADLQGANLTGANLEYANLKGANLKGANLTGANLRGAILAGFGAAELQEARMLGINIPYSWGDARNLTQEQLDAAEGDDRTQLPEGLTRPAHWSSKAEESQDPPATQPGDAENAPAPAGAPGSEK